MDRRELLLHFRESLASVSAPRFFKTERGYQGALLAQLEKRIPRYVMPKGAIIEQEYQKRLVEHGLKIRPDIIIHEPFDPMHHADRSKGNFAVIELKLRASSAEAREDFHNLAAMIDILHYPVGIFINIGSALNHFELVPKRMRGRIVSFAVSQEDGHVRICESGR